MTFLRLATPSFAFASFLLVACGDDHTASTGDDDTHDTPTGGHTDAGKKNDAGTSTRSDAGSAGNPGNGNTGMPGNGNQPAPKQLVQLDDCGDDNQAGLSATQIDQLKAGGSSDGIRWLYPYDGTVFPRGLTAPMMMWDGGGSAVYVKISAQYFAYEGCLEPNAAGQLQLPQMAWDTAGEQTLGPSTPFAVELSVLDGDTVRGPIKETLTIAQATLKGSLFYNSYNSSTGGALGGLGGLGGGLGIPTGGSILRIKPGQMAESFARQGACVGCHTVSANGERMVAKDFTSIADGDVFTLAPDTADNPAPSRQTANAAFVGLSPDGSVYINTAVQNGVGPNTQGAMPVLLNVSANLIETDTGTVVANSGVPATAMMPTFSSDASLIAFSDYADAAGKSISLMDYDAQARSASNPRVLYTSPNHLTGWPFVLPDNGGVIFTANDSNAYSGEGVGIVGGVISSGPYSDLMIADAQTGVGTLLAKAMGYQTPDDAASENTYLPYGKDELHQAYYPTVSPVAAGGYFWVFFDSVRHYGNQGLHRQLWGTAVAIQHNQGEFNSPDGLYGLDPSAPAFYVPGQELNSANHRAFTALDPCRADGATCETGLDCCSGFCTDGVCGPPSGCSDTFEACTMDSDCCNSTDKCIGGYCGTTFL